jgi:ABC-type dipeptide/oligopeptide/nickel transport system permease component
MSFHLVRRLFGAALVLLAVTAVTFFALTTAPGDAAAGLIGDTASPEQLARLRAELGLDRPALARYVDFVAGLAVGNLGHSLMSGRPVTGLLLERLPPTILLALTAMLAATGIGTLAGLLAAQRAGSWFDTGVMSLVNIGLALPTFWVALLLILLFSLRLHWLPVVGAGTPAHLVLPAVTLALPTIAVVARLVRSALLDVLGADYVRTAHAKGLPAHQVLRRHVLRNALIPVLTVLGMHLGHLLGGAFIVETVFGWPGLGRMTVQAIFDRDLPVVLGATVTIAALYVLLNLLVDLLHAWIDPRVAADVI